MKFNLITDKGKKIPADDTSVQIVFKDSVMEVIEPPAERPVVELVSDDYVPLPPPPPPRVMFRGELIEQSEFLALIEGVIIRGKYRHNKGKAVEVTRGRFEMDHTFSKAKHMEAEDTMHMSFRLNGIDEV